jgi:hypothetical protein
MSTTHTATKGSHMATDASTETRISEQGNTFTAEQIQGFILAALAHDTVADEVDDLLHKHVVEGKLHPTVVAESLLPIISEVLQTATFDDLMAVTDQLTVEARESLGIETTASPR